jgi:hypothetical protein
MYIVPKICTLLACAKAAAGAAKAPATASVISFLFIQNSPVQF